jgi:hypothetical protein
MGTRFTEVIEGIIHAAGGPEAHEKNGHYHLRVENEPYMPLVVESWNGPQRDKDGLPVTYISVAHYFKQNGDTVPDPEVLILSNGEPIELSQALGYSRCAWFEKGRLQVNPVVSKDIQRFLNIWAKNIKEQGFIQAARRAAVRG